MQIVSEDDASTPLKRSFTLTILGGEFGGGAEAKKERAAQVRMPGFRPGKVPANLVRKMRGEAVGPDELSKVVEEGVQSLLADVAADATGGSRWNAIGEREDVEIRLALEVLPSVPEPYIDGIRLLCLRAEATADEVSAEIARLSELEREGGDGQTNRAGRRAAASKSRGGKAGGSRSAELEKIARAIVEARLADLSRSFLKRQLLDRLADANQFKVPATMVEAEFDQVWTRLIEEASGHEDSATAIADIERDREEIREIAERRVRLGLLLSEVGQRHGVEISDAEMRQAVKEASEHYSAEDRERFVDYIRSEPMAAAQLRAPLYENKVVDFILRRSTIVDRVVDRAALQEAVETGGFPEIDEAIRADGEPGSEADAPGEQALTSEARADLLREAAASGASPAVHRPELERETRSLAFDLLGATTVLGRSIDSEEDLAEAINTGFPSEVINSLRQAGWSPAVLENVVAPKRTLMRRKSAGQRLTPAESDAAWRLAYILSLASTVLNGRKAAIDWLSRPKTALQRHLPIELLRSGVGTGLVAALLRRLDEGDVA